MLHRLLSKGASWDSAIYPQRPASNTGLWPLAGTNYLIPTPLSLECSQSMGDPSSTHMFTNSKTKGHEEILSWWRFLYTQATNSPGASF